MHKSVFYAPSFLQQVALPTAEIQLINLIYRGLTLMDFDCNWIVIGSKHAWNLICMTVQIGPDSGIREQTRCRFLNGSKYAMRPQMTDDRTTWDPTVEADVGIGWNNTADDKDGGMSASVCGVPPRA